eukprot:scaffold69607_cov27-Tisochrysis_lutea.AAC.2
MSFPASATTGTSPVGAFIELGVTVYSWKKYELEVRLERPSRSLLVSSGRGSRFLAAPFRSPSPVSGRASSRPSIHAHAEDMGRLSIQSRGSLAGNIVQQIVMRISSCSELWDWCACLWESLPLLYCDGKRPKRTASGRKYLLNCFPQEIVDVDSQNALAAGMGFYWTIGDFHRLVEREGHKTQRSPTFQIGDCEWRLRLHPTGSTSSFARSANHSTPLHISIFLEIVGVKYPSNSWSCGVGVTVTIENADHRRAIVRQAPLIFSETMVANGWQNFAPLDEILNHNSGFTDRGSLVVSVNLSCVSIGEATHAS